MNKFPTILWIPGLGHRPIHFKRIIDQFVNQGWQSECVNLPSSNVEAKERTFISDSKETQDHLNRLIEQQKHQVIIVAHSYGAMVANQACEEKFKTTTTSTKEEPGLLGIIFLSGNLFSQGDSVMKLTGGKIPGHCKVEGDVFEMVNVKELCYSDLSKEEANHWASFVTKPPIELMYAEQSHICYGKYPLAYIYLENDQTNSINSQRRLSEMISEKYNVQWKQDSLPTSHSPFLSQPPLLFDTITRLIPKL